MVDLLDDRFLVHNAVHKPTIKLLRFCVLDERQSELYHEDLVDLMYIICSKIHGFPALLNIFFHDKQWLTTPQKPSPPLPPNTTLPEYEFLLFTYLLRFVHREGRSGDFARTGLLFLMEMATHQLGDFILESDFATIMSAGLGALYSQLPRKLIIKDDTEINSTPASYLLGQDLDMRMYPSEELGVEQSNSEQFKYQLDSFLKLLEFCQDILIRCPNDAISARLLQCMRMIFLENILYPSILECSDIDGSSVAVVSYIDLILQTVQQQDLAVVIVGFLMDNQDEDNQPTTKLTSPISPTHNLFAAERFTLKDLIFSRLKSSSQPTVIATLKLLKTLITKHCRFANRLLSTCPDTTSTHDNTDPIPSTTIISHHIREIELYFSLISAIDTEHADDILAFGYENYLYDIELQMNRDPCFQHATQQHAPTTTTITSSKSEKRRSFKYGQQQRTSVDFSPHQPQNVVVQQRHRIRPTDTLIQILLGLLSHFFAQTPELNLALTGVISALAICPYRSLEGWISFCESDRTHANDVLDLSSTQSSTPTQEEDEGHGIRSDDIYALSAIQEQEREQGQDDDQSIDFGADRNSIRMTAPTHFKSFPPFYTLLRTLTQQIDYYRSEVDDFDRLLDERWNGLLFGEPTSYSVPGTPTPRRNSTFEQQPAAPSPKIFGQQQRRNSLGLLKTSVAAPPPIINPLSPLALHAKKTLRVRIQPLFPSNFEIDRDEPILNLDEEDEDMFAPQPTTNPSQRKKMDKTTEISLSMLLNNVVILEETIKELVAIMQVRRSLGIDRIRYT
ncbi:Retinoic acid induced 16-like protein-domain-containing protein [Helicostylum pulchrum]|nr:Retinoic acid induced 16-like protein-domain-containing protein [Helicostylum pulchrum]